MVRWKTIIFITMLKDQEVNTVGNSTTVISLTRLFQERKIGPREVIFHVMAMLVVLNLRQL